MKIQIKNRWTGEVLFEYEHKDNSIKRTVEKAVEAGVNLSGADLTRANLPKINLCEANLSGANLTGAILYKANLYRTNLTGTVMEEANLYGAVLERTNLEKAILKRTNLYRANLAVTNLSEANLEGALLERANLTGAILKRANLYVANLCGANLIGTNLEKANLIGTNLYGAILEKANLYRANLNRANLTETSLYETKGIPKIYRNDLSIIKNQDCMLKAYKYLYGDKSPYRDFKYEVGREYVFDDINEDETVLCDAGGNVATLEWCLRDCGCDLKYTFIEVEFHSKDAVIPINSDGKFRVRKFKVLRKLNKEELKPYLE